MRFARVALIMAVVLSLGLAMGCGNEEQSKADKMKNKIKEAAQAVADFTADQKNKFMKEMSSRWDSLRKDAEKLQKDLEAKGSKESKEISATIGKLKTEYADKLDKLGKSSGDAAKQAKVELEKAWAKLKEAYDAAKDKLK